jgi:hypothetical protein
MRPSWHEAPAEEARGIRPEKPVGRVRERQEVYPVDVMATARCGPDQRRLMRNGAYWYENPARPMFPKETKIRLD